MIPALTDQEDLFDIIITMLRLTTCLSQSKTNHVHQYVQ